MFRTEKIILQKNPNTIRINFNEKNLSKISESTTKINQRENLKKLNDKNKYESRAYKILIKKIAYQLKKRTKLPKCKIFKFYLPYKLLITRIAKKLKSTAKKLNFWDKTETEMTLQDVDQIQEIASTAMKIIQQKKIKKNPKKKNNTNNTNKNDTNNTNKQQKKKSPKMQLSLLKKTEEEKMNLEKNNKNNKLNKNHNQVILNNLKAIEINKKDINNFLKKFSNFLNDNNIEIIRENKLPNFTSKEKDNKYLLTQKDFWIKYIIYISEKYKNELSLFNFINFIEQFFLWCNPPGDNMDFIVEIKLQIYKIFDEQKINNFLSVNKLSNLDQLFERYKNLNSKEEKCVEAKIDLDQCTCPICTEGGYYKKVVDYNKVNNKIIFAEKNNLSFSSMNDIYIKFDKDKTLYNNGKINIEYSILSENKYYDADIFNYLNKIEKGKAESERKKKRNPSSKKKSRNNSVKNEIKEIKNEAKEIKNEAKDKKAKNKNINAILDLMGLEADSQSE